MATAFRMDLSRRFVRPRLPIARRSLIAGCRVLVGWAALTCCAAGLAAGERADAEKRVNAEQTGASQPEFSAADVEFFQKRVEPILKEHCLGCHGASKPKAGLRLISRREVLAGGDSGAAALPGKPGESLLIEAVNYDSYEMPPKGKLPAEQLQTLTEWVRRGLPWTPGAPREVAESETHGPPAVNDQTRSFWSFQPVKSPEPPALGDPWVRGPIDAFVLARLKQAGLRPAQSAEKGALLRRASYDLTGLPPTPEEVRAFLADESDDAYEKVIDRLLESPRYGEKWGRHWLDLVRYAETNSYERDGPKPFVWRYRDYVIDAFNQDKPYDEFIREQLAGDELEPGDPEALIATGYYRLGIWDDEPADPELALYDDLDDILTTTSQVFLGLTINCGRCHDHKIDPIPQRDYYRMLAFFRGLNRFGIRGGDTIERFSLRDIATAEEKQAQQQEIRKHEQRVKRVEREIAELEKKVREDFTPVEKEEFRHEMNRLAIVQRRVGGLLNEDQFARYEQLFRQRRQLNEFKPPALRQALCVTEVGSQPRETWVLVRGNPEAKGDPVEPGFPSVLGFPSPEIPEAAPGAASSGRRGALARWIARPDNPLTARVAANRVWQYHFGRGIVATPNDFGFQGSRPTHPELLDWLAAELVAGGWRLKPLHKQIMLSSTYRMASAENSAALARDPENKLLWRFDMRRLTAEEVRDSILAVNGSLNLQMAGPSFYPVIPPAVLAGQSRPGAGWGNSSPEDRNRRSIYIHVKRSLMTPIIASFDGPESDFSCPVRFSTTQPTQALGMLNSEFLNRQAEVFAEFLRREVGPDPTDQVRLGLTRATQRVPTEEEVQRGVAFIESLCSEEELAEPVALRLFCVLALNLNEFLYLE